MATPNIVPQSENDGNLGRHSLRWASTYTYRVSSPAIRVVRDATANTEVFTTIATDSNGDITINKEDGNGAKPLATAESVTTLSGTVTTINSSLLTRPSVTEITGATTVANISGTEQHRIYYATGAVGVTLSLPTAAGITGFKITAKSLLTNNANLTTTPQADQSVDGGVNGASILLTNNNTQITLVSTGTNWISI